MIRVLVVDDQALVRGGVCLMLRTAGEDVVGEAPDGNQAVRLADRLRPDVILMDLRMPHMDGIEATRRILAAHPAIRILMLTTFDEDAEVYGALQAGAVGYLLKDGSPDTLIDAVRRAAHGESLLAPAVLAKVVARAVHAHRHDTADNRVAGRDDLALLSPRERQVLSLLGAGRSNAEIGAVLHLGVTTVKSHVAAVTEKLSLRNRVQAAVRAHQLGLIDDDFRPVDEQPADRPE